MTASARSRFIVSQQLIPFVINAVLNGWIAWAIHKNDTALPLWGSNGYATDLIATGLLLPSITWLILWPLLFKQAAAGRAPATDGIPQPWGIRLMPSALWRGAVVIGLIGGFFGLVVAVIMQALGAPAMTGQNYAIFKGVYGGLFPVLLQPAMVFAILRQASLVPARNG